METTEAIWKQAEKDLVFANGRREPEQLLWEHSSAVARFALRMLALPSVQSRQLDALVVLAGSLYHDADYAARFLGRGLVESECLTRTGDPGHRDRSASILADRLGKALSPERLQSGCRVVREVGVPQTKLPEAQVVSDADNLHQLGLLTLWPVIRQGAGTGKGIADVIERWKTWKTYCYWPARRETFFFTEVRNLAEVRIEVYERFISQLTAEHSGADLERLLDASAPRNQPAGI